MSVNNTQAMEAFLKADQRVHLVVQVRDPQQFATSVMGLGKQDGLPGRRVGRSEAFLLGSRGITAASVPSRADRVAEYMRSVTKEADWLARLKPYMHRHSGW